MIKRVFLPFLVFLMLAFLPAINVRAEEITYTYIPGEEENDSAKTESALKEALPEAVRERLSPTTAELLHGDVQNPFKILGDLLGAFPDELDRPLQLAVRLTALIILSTLLSAVLSLGKGTELAGKLCRAAVFSLALFPTMKGLLQGVTELVHELDTFLIALLPIFTSLSAAGGGSAVAAVTNAGLYLFTALSEHICADALLPVCSVLFCLIVAAAVSGIDLSGAVKLLRDAYSWAIGFSVMLVTAVYSFGSSVAAARDSIALRAVRFAAGNFIPVVGGAVSEAIRTVSGSLKLVRSAVGWIAFAALLLLLVPPVIRLLLYRMAIGFCAAEARMAGLETEARLLDGAAQVCGLLTAALAAVAALFLIAVTVFVLSATAGVA